MKALFFATLIVATSFTTINAQTGSPKINDGKCWLGSASFTAGATARAGNQTMVCTKDRSWEKTDITSSVCIYGGKPYATGSLIGATNNKGILQTCLENGTWELKDVK